MAYDEEADDTEYGVCSPSPFCGQHIETLKDLRNQGGLSMFNRPTTAGTPLTVQTMGTRGDERGENDG